MDDLTEIKQRLDALEMRRVHQSDIPPYTIKQRHLESNISLSETFISDKIVSQMTVLGDSYSNFSPELSITFTPNFTRKYLIFGNYRVSTDSLDDIGRMIINNEIGNAEILIQNETSFYITSTEIASYPCYVYIIANLTKDKEYKFTLQGKQDYADKNIIVKSSTYGNYLVAQSL